MYLTRFDYKMYFMECKEGLTAMYRNDLIVKAMEEQGKTNESLAHEVKLSHATISAIRNGTTDPKLSTFLVIAAALELDPAELLPAKAA